MRISLQVVVMALVLAPAGRVAAQAEAALELGVLVDGAAPPSPCSASLRNGGTRVEGEAPGTLRAEAGSYELRVRCTRGEDTLIVSDIITLRPGTAKKALQLQSTRLRVIARREGALKPASVQVLPARAKPDAEPLLTLPANQKQVIAAGTYDLIVRAEAKKDGGRAEALVKNARVSGKGVTEIAADLSDGKLSVSVTDNGRPAEGAVRVFHPGSKAQAAMGPAGEPLVLAPGPYLVETTLGGVADFPVRRTEVRVEAGKLARLSERFETGRLTVGVFRDRTPVEALVRLTLPGAEDFFNYFASPGTVSLTPGTYDVVVAPKDGVPVERLRRPRVTVTRGRENKIAFDLTPAKLTVRVRRAGKPLDLAEVLVLAAGGGAEAAKAETDGTFQLWPGRYEILAKLPDGDETRDGPFEVGFGEALTRTIEFTRGTLTVHATRGGAVASDAEITVFKRGAQKPVAQGRPRALLELSPGTYDVKVVAGAVTQWLEAVRIKEGKTVRLDVAFAPARDAGALPEGELAPGLPEGEP